ncbi:ABC transporter permease [Curtobacterium sp. PhB115]|uniref:ABC transporter permease n=1 Tax=Curtobacterium sp. PhB115 TaxID=2485173 RepID=UPI000FA77D04|nr:ABC transporter permease subunit [Curtobacterium sp. PhB115]ROP63971.1 osmoprotectant transport system permease protein [Curtobacterium sp. PhB115]
MNWVFGNLDTITSNLIAHVWLSIPPIVISFVLSVPIGLLVSRLRARTGPARATGSTVVVIASLLYTIPALPLFLVLPAILGTSYLDPVNVIIALTIFGVALMVRSAADAIDAVDPDVVQASEALGYSPVQRFFRVELPLSGPVLLAGIRVVSVSTISLVTVGALIGIPNLGFLLTDGLKRGISVEILTGIVLTIVLALAIDGLLVLLGRLVMPWTRGGSRAARAVRRRAAADVETQKVAA